MSQMVWENSAGLSNALTDTFDRLREAQYMVARSDARQRKQKLRLLKRTIMKYRENIREALYLDFRKHAFEVDLTEIYPVISEIKHVLRNLRHWMGRHPVSTPVALMGSRSRIQYEPKGIVLIISPWNFPITLTLGPLVSAIASGNTVIVKPSEHTPNATYIMEKIIREVFPPDEVAMVTGGVEISRELLKLPFNHIFFTGSSEVGKKVMEAAARNLASVTLELGGKSPTIVDETADIEQAARRISWVKNINNGQICIAPDHVYVHEKVLQKFTDAVVRYLRQFYGEDPRQAPSYARLVNDAHYQRLTGFLEDAVNHGARIVHGGKVGPEENYMEPTILTGMTTGSKVMMEEIFGPILPIIPFESIDQLTEILIQQEKPLATYIYSRSRKNIRKIINDTRSGALCINHSGIHFFNNHLPFGGSNFSGIGKGHGWFGYQAFSNARAIYDQVIPGALEVLVPPYNRIKQMILDFTIKYL